MLLNFNRIGNMQHNAKSSHVSVEEVIEPSTIRSPLLARGPHGSPGDEDNIDSPQRSLVSSDLYTFDATNKMLCRHADYLFHSSFTACLLELSLIRS